MLTHGGGHVTATDPSALTTTRGLVAVEGQYTLHNWGGARTIELSIKGRSSALHTLRHESYTGNCNTGAEQIMGAYGGCTKELRRRSAATR